MIEQWLLDSWHPYGCEALQAIRKFPQGSNRTERAYKVLREMKLLIREKHGQDAWKEFHKNLFIRIQPLLSRLDTQ